MKYYDSTSGKIRDTMKDSFTHPYYNEKAAKLQNMFGAVALPIMAITVILQIFWLNIILHCILCSLIIVLCTGRLVCDIIQKDKKNIFTLVSFIVIWFVNMLLYLLHHFGF